MIDSAETEDRRQASLQTTVVKKRGEKEEVAENPVPFLLPIHPGEFEGEWGILLYLQREGGLRTRQGRRAECAEKDGGFTYYPQTTSYNCPGCSTVVPPAARTSEIRTVLEAYWLVRARVPISGSRGSHGGLGGRSEIATLNRPLLRGRGADTLDDFARQLQLGHGVRNHVLTNRHAYTYGILEGIGVCIGVPAKRGQTQNTTGIGTQGDPTTATPEPSKYADQSHTAATNEDFDIFSSL